MLSDKAFFPNKINSSTQGQDSPLNALPRRDKKNMELIFSFHLKKHVLFETPKKQMEFFIIVWRGESLLRKNMWIERKQVQWSCPSICSPLILVLYRLPEEVSGTPRDSTFFSAAVSNLPPVLRFSMLFSLICASRANLEGLFVGSSSGITSEKDKTRNLMTLNILKCKHNMSLKTLKCSVHDKYVPFTFSASFFFIWPTPSPCPPAALLALLRRAPENSTFHNVYKTRIEKKFVARHEPTCYKKYRSQLPRVGCFGVMKSTSFSNFLDCVLFFCVAF